MSKIRDFQKCVRSESDCFGYFVLDSILKTRRNKYAEYTYMTLGFRIVLKGGGKNKQNNQVKQ